MHQSIARLVLSCVLAAGSIPSALAQDCPASVPVQGAPPPAPLPLFPANNWWNLDISNAPVDAGSQAFINFINNGGTRRLHPDFGGEAGGVNIYGFPYAIVGGTQGKQAVTFDYWDESDGADPETGEGVPFYPIPTQAITQSHWIEGGARGNIDQRGTNDRHLLVIDCTNRHLYELYNVYFNPVEARWYAGSGAFFDLDSNERRPDGWTSADAAGLAIFPGLVRYDEVANSAVAEIGHAFRVTVRATNGYVYPASHLAGTTAGALPMGARLRLKTSVNGLDPALRTADANARKIFRAMQKHGLIVADNGSDMYISGTFDVRWQNDELNPAFSTLSASDFEVIQLGWNPPPPSLPALLGVTASPNPVFGGADATGTATLNAPAPAGGAVVALASASPAFSVPPSVTVPATASSATFNIATTPVTVNSAGTLSAAYAGVTKTTSVTVTPAPPTLSVADLSIIEGNSGSKLATFTIKLSRAAPAAVTYDISTANGTALAGSDYVGKSLVGETIAAGASSRTFTVTISGDTAIEPNEGFSVNVSSATGTFNTTDQALAAITNDDGPTLSIADISVAEGSSGSSVATFTVKLSKVSANPASYSIATANNSAVAGSDYIARSLAGETIAPGQLTRTFAVTVLGDATLEANQAFLVKLSAAAGTSIRDSQAVGTILNDDGPTLSVTDVSIAEGNAGSKLANFTVSQSQASTAATTYTIATANSSALAGSDYVARTQSGQSIPAGQLSNTFAVTINGDTELEPSQVFKVNLSAAKGASIFDKQGNGTIVNDD